MTITIWKNKKRGTSRYQILLWKWGIKYGVSYGFDTCWDTIIPNRTKNFIQQIKEQKQ